MTLGLKENQDPQILSWRDTVKAIRVAFAEAKRSANVIRARKDWNQMIYCFHIMTEIEDLISRSETKRQWIYNISPLTQKFQEELQKLDEAWAWTLAAKMHHLMRDFPVA
jgi:hypothetical protein